MGRLKIFKLITKHSWLWLLFFTIAAGCATLNGASNADCSPDGVLLIDSFNDNESCGWYLYEDDSLTGASRIAGGKLELTSREAGQFWWSNPGISATDVTISAVTRKLSGPDDNAFGLMCRYQDPNNFYLFVISADGYYAIGKVESGVEAIQYLTGEGEYLFSEVIQQGVQENTIRVTCEGDQLSLTVNGILLDVVTDDSFRSGDIGVGLTAFEPGTAVAEFDDVRVIEP